MGVSNVLVLAPIGIRLVTRKEWTDALESIKRICIANGTAYIYIDKDNSRDHGSRAFVKRCETAFQEATDSNTPSVIVIGGNNGDGSERKDWINALDRKLSPKSCNSVVFSLVDVVDHRNVAALSVTRDKPGRNSNIGTMKRQDILNVNCAQEIHEEFHPEMLSMKFNVQPVQGIRCLTNGYKESLAGKIKRLRPVVRHEVLAPCRCHGRPVSPAAPWADDAENEPYEAPFDWEDACDVGIHSRYVDTVARQIVSNLGWSRRFDY
jgi:hypothetical protein